jgi:hypothetical protein
MSALRSYAILSISLQLAACGENAGSGDAGSGADASTASSDAAAGDASASPSDAAALRPLSCVSLLGLADGGRTILTCAEYRDRIRPASCGVLEEIESCPVERRVGRCQLPDSSNVLFTYRPATTDAARSGCESAGGSFTPI